MASHPDPWPRRRGGWDSKAVWSLAFFSEDQMGFCSGLTLRHHLPGYQHCPTLTMTILGLIVVSWKEQEEHMVKVVFSTSCTLTSHLPISLITSMFAVHQCYLITCGPVKLNPNKRYLPLLKGTCKNPMVNNTVMDDRIPAYWYITMSVKKQKKQHIISEQEYIAFHAYWYGGAN